MITPAPRRNTNFAENYKILGEYVQDDSRIPYFNPSDSDTMIEPGEPVLVTWMGGQEAMMAQGPIHPNEVGMFNRYFTGDFPCNFSADTLAGTEVMWDADTKQVKLAGDVTNGFVLGVLSWHIDPLIHHSRPAVNGSGKVIAANADSTNCRVVGIVGQATVKGAVTPLSLDAAPVAASTRKAKKAE